MPIGTSKQNESQWIHIVVVLKVPFAVNCACVGGHAAPSRATAAAGALEGQLQPLLGGDLSEVDKCFMASGKRGEKNLGCHGGRGDIRGEKDKAMRI